MRSRAQGLRAGESDDYAVSRRVAPMGDLLAKMARKLEIARVSKAFANEKSSNAVSHLQDLEVIQVEPRGWEF